MKQKNNESYQALPQTRRELLLKAGGIALVGAGVGWVSFAPEEDRGSRKDHSGLRSRPVHSSLVLPDFRVESSTYRPAVSVGRGLDARKNLRKALDGLGGLRSFITPDDVVLVKPNVAFDRSPQLGATSNPDLLEFLLRMLFEDCKVQEVRVADNPIESPADCFAKSGIQAASEAGGARVYLPDSNSFKTLHTPGASLIPQWDFFHRPFKGVTKVIGLAPVKDHNLSHASMGLKNWYGLLGGARNQFHQDIHGIISDLSIMIRPTLTILDGTRVLIKNGPTGGNPDHVKNRGAVLVGTDPVAMDSWAFEHLLKRGTELPAYLPMAEKKGGGTGVL